VKELSVANVSILVFIMLLSLGAQATPPVLLEASIGKYNLGLNADVLEDINGELTIEQVSNSRYDDQWAASQKIVPNFTFSDSAYWLRVTFTSELTASAVYWFEVAFALQDYLDYYVINEGEITHITQTGDRLPFDSRPYEYRNFLFDFPISPGETKQVYLRLQSHDGIHEPSPIILWDKQSFTFASSAESLGLGLYFGIMVVMVVYNLFIFLMVRDRAYIYYVLYISGFMFWLATYYGYSFQYLWPDSPDWGNQAIPLTSGFWFVFMIHFVSSFLETKRVAPWFERPKQALIVLVLFFMIFSFTGAYASLVSITIVFGISSSIVCLIVGYLCLRAGLRQAKFFLLAWTTLLVSLTVFSLKIAGFLPSIFVVEKSVQIGSVLEVMLLSLGLADRINVLKSEKILAQEESIRASESSLKLKNDLLTSVSHELRTPMNAILGGLQVAQTHPLERLKPPFDIVQDGASEMMCLVNDILTHTEIQSQSLHIESTNTAMLPLLQIIRRRYQKLCKEKNMSLCWQVDQDLPEWLLVDERKLQIIFSKLLDNAVKFTDQGNIHFSLSCNREESPWRLILLVEDNGIGIEKTKQQHIFDAFTQSEGGFQRGFSGLGIGLAICCSLTEAIGGKLTLRSKVGLGSSFRVELPVLAGKQPEEPEEKSLASAALPILIVEDNAVNQRIMIKMLQKLGYRTLISNNGSEALETLKKNEVSVVLMDLQMPIMDGFCCAERIRARTDDICGVPIIAVTANLMDADKAHCVKSGMNDFLEKPVKLTNLQSSLSQYVESPSSKSSS